MNRLTFLKTLFGAAVVPGVLAKAIQQPPAEPRQVLLETRRNGVLIRRVYVDEIEWMQVKDNDEVEFGWYKGRIHKLYPYAHTLVTE